MHALRKRRQRRPYSLVCEVVGKWKKKKKTANPNVEIIITYRWFVLLVREKKGGMSYDDFTSCSVEHTQPCELSFFFDSRPYLGGLWSFEESCEEERTPEVELQAVCIGSCAQNRMIKAKKAVT